MESMKEIDALWVIVYPGGEDNGGAMESMKEIDALWAIVYPGGEDNGGAFAPEYKAWNVIEHSMFPVILWELTTSLKMGITPSK